MPTLLLNVGPMPDGRIQPECVERLNEIGRWMERYGETIYGTCAGPVKPQPWGAVTSKDDRLYIHVLDPGSGPVELPAIKIKSAALMDTGTAVGWTRDKESGMVVFDTCGASDPIDSVIVVTLK